MMAILDICPVSRRKPVPSRTVRFFTKQARTAAHRTVTLTPPPPLPKNKARTEVHAEKPCKNNRQCPTTETLAYMQPLKKPPSAPLGAKTRVIKAKRYSSRR